MANEIQLPVFRSGATLTYGAYQPDGTVRTAAGTSLPEIGTTGYYTADDANVVVGDSVVIREGSREVGGGIYEIPQFAMRGTDLAATEAKQDIMQTSVVNIIDIQEGDMTIDTTQTPWQMVIKKKSTATELIRKDLKTPAGVDITSAASIIGQLVEP